MMRALLLLLICVMTSGAFAQDQGHVRFLKYQSDYRVNPDATYSVVQEVAYRLLTEAALVGSGKMPISFSSKLEEAEVLEAYTLKNDGRRIDVGASGIQTQQGQVAAGYGISQNDQRTLMITFPNLEVGDTIHYKYKLTQKEAIFPGQFYASAMYARSLAWDAIDVSIDAPLTLALQVETVKLSKLPEVEQDGRRIYRWQARNLPIVASESGAVDLLPGTPHFIASTFKDWGQFSTAYEARAKVKAAVTPTVAAMAEQITRDASEPRVQAQLLYEWVAKNIRYVASWIGAEGWVPHAADSVLANRYGDCKDHVVLLEALLAAKGIASTTVMLNSDKTSYSLPSVVYPAFNHVITYVPTLDVYLDSTAGTSTPFGVLPVSDADKPAIHTTSFADIRRTPTLNATQFSSVRTTRITVADNGDASVEFSVAATGAAAIDLRQTRLAIGKGKETEWVRELLDGQGLEGEGSVAFDENPERSGMTMRLDVTVRNFLAMTEYGTIPLNPLVTGPIAFDHLRGIYKRAARTQPYWCPAWSLEDRYEIRVPKTFKLMVPKGRVIKEGDFVYRSEYGVHGDLLTVVRHLSIERGTLACQPAEYATGKAALARIEHDLRTQVIYQTSDPDGSNEK